MAQPDGLTYRHPLLDRHYWLGFTPGHAQPEARLLSDNYDLLLGSTLAGVCRLAPSLKPCLQGGEPMQLLPEYDRDPDAFGPLILAVYPVIAG
ncbi:hypothetical protein [Pseudomonas sp. 2FE]|uniref:hypothetical protein n=1 Tax=Pseudomonas sp. 2FE TaxID=2502190 RepID=UPI0010F6C55D|nr:hypothetical protein [Pseudomonas sp. 2FE]